MNQFKVSYGFTVVMIFNLMLMLVSPVVIKAQSRYSYGLNPVRMDQYHKMVKTDPQNELINLKHFIPGIVLDIRYATTNNFTGERIYTLARAYARKPVAEALKRAQEDFKKEGVGIKIFDAYRPYSATVKFYETYRDTTYVASPYKGSKHNRGCALDMSIIDLMTGKELPMPTEFDSFKKEAWPSTPVNDPVIRRNRQLLISVMEKNGFRVNPFEWWHFDFVGWEKFEVMDIDFEELE